MFLLFTQDPRPCFTWLLLCQTFTSQHLRCLNTKSSHPMDPFKWVTLRSLSSRMHKAYKNMFLIGSHVGINAFYSMLYVLCVLLQLSLNMVPKILSPLVKDWAPKAFVISFKLETDATILLEKSRRALETYRHQAVVANVLDSRRGYVVVVTPESQAELILTEEDEKNDVEIEVRIVSNLTGAHNNFITQQGEWVVNATCYSQKMATPHFCPRCPDCEFAFNCYRTWITFRLLAHCRLLLLTKRQPAMCSTVQFAYIQQFNL